MQVIQDDLWFCVDCLVVACNGDYSGVEGDDRVAVINAGLDKLGPNVVPDFDSDTGEGILEFSKCGCDCCGSKLAGTMHRFAVLGDDEAED